MKSIILRPRYVIGLWLLAILCASASAQENTAGTPPPSLVTAEVLEAKIAEVEAAGGIDEQVKSVLVELYRKALSNLQEAISNRDAAQAFQKAARTAPAETEAIREGMDESNVVAPEDTLEANRSTPLRQLESLRQKEKADLAAVNARRADFAKRLDEEAGRPTLIRQRLAEAKQQQDDVATQLKLPPPADEGPEKQRRGGGCWRPETRH